MAGEKVVINVQFGGKDRGKVLPAPDVEVPFETAAEDLEPAQPSKEDGAKSTPSAEEFVGLLRDMLDGGLGEGLGGVNRTLVNRSAQEYSGEVSRYTNNQIQPFVDTAEDYKRKKPAFYAAIQAEARKRRIFKKT